MSTFDEPNARVRPPSAASRAQVRANRRNAKRSTGPRTDDGKRRSSRNAATHGIFCKDAVLPGERNSEYIAFRNLLLNSPGLKPQTWLELSFAEQFVLAKWRIRRLLSTESLEHRCIADSLAEAASMSRADFEHVMELRERYMTLKEANDAAEDGEDETDEAAQERAEQLRQKQLDRSYALNRLFVRMNRQQRVPATVTLATSLVPGGEHAGVFERLDRLQHRMELSAHRAMRELRQLRKDLGVDVASLPDCPFLEEVVQEQEPLAEEDVVAEATTPLEEANAREPVEERRGMVTSVTMSSHPRIQRPTSLHAPSNANVQNEPNSEKTSAGDEGSEDCAQGSRKIEPVTPTKLAPRGAANVVDDEREARDRT